MSACRLETSGLLQDERVDPIAADRDDVLLGLEHGPAAVVNLVVPETHWGDRNLGRQRRQCVRVGRHLPVSMYYMYDTHAHAALSLDRIGGFR